MRLIKYGLLTFGLVLITACGKKAEEPAVESAPATTVAPAPAPEAAAPATESAATPAPAAEGAMTPAPTADNALKTESTATATACPTGCISMNCPPPSGPVQCCKRTTSGYKTCTL